MCSGPGSQRWARCFLLALAVLTAVASAAAQQTSSSSTPLASSEESSAAERPVVSPAVFALEKPVPPHRFWDRTNLWLFSVTAAARGLDYASTQNMLARGREEILLPGEVVANHAGFAALEAAGTATSVELAYLLHRTGHHKLERWLSLGHIGVATFGDARNYALKSRHR